MGVGYGAFSMSDRNFGIQPVANPSAGGTVTPDMSLGGQLVVNLPSGNITIANPINANLGDWLTLYIKQDLIGARLVTWGAQYATNVVLSLGASAVDAVTFRVYPGVWFQVAASLNI